MESSTTTAPIATEAPAAEQSVGFGKPDKAYIKKMKNKNKHFKKAPTTAEGAAEGGKKEGGKKGGDVNSNVAAAAKKAAASNPNEPYIFIIKNAENDLCRIHESALPQFLGLNLKNQEKRHAGASFYEIKIRSETRTGEITFHGKDEAAFFKTSDPNAAANAKKGGVNINKKAGEKREREEEEAAESAEAAPAVDPATQGEATVQPTEGEARYSTVNDMLDNVRSRPYYNAHLSYNHTTGADASTSQMGRLTGAVAEVNQKLGPKQLRKALKDVRGFLSCWFLKATGPSTTQFRVVFETEADLLEAKEMLDQFEADAGVRVSLKLSDNMQAKFQKFLVEKASGGAESGDVVALSTPNADYE